MLSEKNNSEDVSKTLKIIINLSSKGDKEVASTITALAENNGIFLSVNPFGSKTTAKLRQQNQIKTIIDAINNQLKSIGTNSYKNVKINFVGHVYYDRKTLQSSENSNTLDSHAYLQNKEVTAKYLGAVNSKDFPELIDTILEAINNYFEKKILGVQMKFVVCNSDDIFIENISSISSIAKKYSNITIDIKTTPHSVTSNLTSFRKEEYVKNLNIEALCSDSDTEKNEKGLLPRLVFKVDAQNRTGSFESYKHLSENEKSNLLPANRWIKYSYNTDSNLHSK